MVRRRVSPRRHDALSAAGAGAGTMTIATREVGSGAEAERLRAELTATQELVRLMAREADLQEVLEAVTLLTGRLIGTGRAILQLLEGDKLAYKAGIPEARGRLWLQSVA